MHTSLKIIFLHLKCLFRLPPALSCLLLPTNWKKYTSLSPLCLLPPSHWFLSPLQAGFCPTSLLKIFLPQLLMSLELLNSIDTFQSLPYLTSREHMTLSFILSLLGKKTKKTSSSLCLQVFLLILLPCLQVWWLLLTLFNELNFLCSFLNVPSCLESHPQHSEALKQGLANFFQKGPDSTYFRLYRPQSLRPNYEEWWLCCSTKAARNNMWTKGRGWVPMKLYLPNRWQLDLGHRPVVCWPLL